MNLQRALFLPTIACLVFACTPAESDDGESAEDTVSTNGDGDGDPGDGDGDETDTLPGDGDGEPAGPVAMVSGMVTDAAGDGLGGAGIQLCGPINDAGEVELCIPVPTDDGSFEIGAMEAALWALKVVHGPLGDRKFGGQSWQIDVVEGMDLDFSAPAIVVPEVASVTDLSAATGEVVVAIDDVLSVIIDPAMATSPDFQPPTELGGVMVPMEHWRHTEVDGAPVLAAWSFSPFGIKSMEGTSFAFTLDDALGLAADDAVTFYEVEKDNGATHMIGTGVVNGDASGIDVTPVGNGFHELSWLLVVQ